MVYFKLSKDGSLHSTRIRAIRFPYLPPNGSSRLFCWRSTRIWRVSRSSLHSALPREYERVAEETWWPALRAKCPVEGPEKISEKEADFRYISLFKNMHTAVEEHIAFSPPHIHTDILRGYRRQGWGKKLIEKTAECMRIDGLWVQRTKGLGFEDIQGSGTNTGLQFDDWKG